MQIILGSSSERRKHILNFFSLPYKQIDSNFDESTISQELSPDKYTCEIAKQKALKISSMYPKDIILTADTVVYFKNKYLLKPKDENEAFSMLKNLSGSTHEVYTGVGLKTENDIFVRAESSKIFFNKLSDIEIKTYHENFFFSDKAGGYAIQNGGSILVKKIEGCFYNVMGLPINTLRELLKKAGIDLWDFLKPSQ
jgi:septum formation protein